MRKLLTYVLLAGVGYYFYNQYKDGQSKTKPKLK